MLQIVLSSTLMPWKCPACQTQIAHDGDMPEPKRVYRCHVCRLELVLDEATRKLAVAPLPTLPNRRATDPKR
jgi:DNA-directed RNA polymerase subunit RPC12/RpoP